VKVSALPQAKQNLLEEMHWDTLGLSQRGERHKRSPHSSRHRETEQNPQGVFSAFRQLHATLCEIPSFNARVTYKVRIQGELPRTVEMKVLAHRAESSAD
jgi:hypothetical protein